MNQHKIRSRIPKKYDSLILQVLDQLWECVSSQTYNNFFKYDFTNLIQEFYSNEKIPNITPIDNDHYDSLINDTNNKICFEFLKKKNPDIFNVPFETIEDKIKVVDLLFTKVIYSFDINQMIHECDEILNLNDREHFFSYDYYFDLAKELGYDLPDKYDDIQRCYDNIKSYNDYPFILDAVKGDLFDEKNRVFYLIQIDKMIERYKFDNEERELKLQKELEKNPICIFFNFFLNIKYFNSIDLIFDKGEFPLLIQHLCGLEEELPGIIKVKNEYDIIRNNLMALKFLKNNSGNIIKSDQSIKTTQERFDLLKSIIFVFSGEIDQDQIFSQLNSYSNKFQIKNIDYLYNPECILKFLCFAFNYNGIERYTLYDFNDNIFEMKREFEKRQSPYYHDLPIFIRSCFYKSDRYKFLILIQFNMIIEYMENEKQTIYIDDDQALSDEHFHEMPIQEEMDEINKRIERQTKQSLKNETRREKRRKIDYNFIFNDNDYYQDEYNMELYNSIKIDDERAYHSYNPYFHFQLKSYHIPKSFCDSDNEAIHQNIYNRFKDGYIIGEIKDENISESSSDFDCFYNSENSSDNDIESPDYEAFLKMTNDVLLNTINTLCENLNLDLHCKDFYQAAKNDAIPKFVMLIQDIKSIKNVKINEKKKKHHHKNKQLSKSEIDNIKAVIHYLQTIEPKFLTLYFDFKNKELIEQNVILFYSTFLNLFFLKMTKQKLFKKCIKILNIKECNKYKILTDFVTYCSLAYFVRNGKLKKKAFKNDEDKKEAFKKAKIPCLFDEQFLQMCKSTHELPDVLYYQLQFIFNALDKKQHPNTKTNDKKSSKPNKKVDKKADITSKYANDKYKYPLTFKERLELYKVSTQKSNSNKNSEFENADVESFDNYWNQFDSDCFCDDGVIVINGNKSENEWWKIEKKDTKTKTKSKEEKHLKKKKLFNNKKLITEEQIKPFKLFVYNEKKGKWFFDKDNFAAFCNKCSLNSDETPTPLILYMDSFEKDLITINSNFINRPYPDLNDDKNQIYVYALCNRNLPFLSYEIDKNPKENDQIKPIFLLLHVPNSKRYHAEIKKIVIQIYSFLSYICDIEIFVLNKNHYKDQVDFIHYINNIYPKKDDLSYKKSNKNQDVNDDDVDNDDDSYNDIQIDKCSDYSDDDDDKVSNAFNKFEIIPKISIKKSNIIVIANDSNVHGDVFEYNEFNFNKNLYEMKYELNGKEKSSFKFHFINLNEASTYEPFLESLKDFALKSDTLFGDILQRFKLVQMSELTSPYINIKIQKHWKDYLDRMISGRFSMFEKSDKSNPIKIMSYIQNELVKIASHYDFEFYQECHSIFTNIAKKYDKNIKIIEDELKRSSLKHIEDMGKLNDEELFNKKTIDSLKESHINFLKKEYFDIVKFISQSKEFVAYYERNIGILDSVINDGIEKIIKLREDVKEYVKSKFAQKDDEDDFIDSSPNYEIRQKENFKEILIQISTNGDLRDEIEQDF